MSEHVQTTLMSAEDSQKVLDEALAGRELFPSQYALDAGSPQAVWTSVTRNVERLAEMLSDLYSGRGNFPTVDELTRYLSTLVALRCDQINHRLEKGVSARDVPVPDFYFPFLAQIGRYEDSLGTRILVPTSIDRASEDDRSGAEAQGGVVYQRMEYGELCRVGRRLKAAGIATHLGLPVKLIADGSSLFRVRQDLKGQLFTDDRILSAPDLFVRSVVWYAYLEAEFGKADICYGSIDS